MQVVRRGSEVELRQGSWLLVGTSWHRRNVQGPDKQEFLLESLWLLLHAIKATSPSAETTFLFLMLSVPHLLFLLCYSSVSYIC